MSLFERITAKVLKVGNRKFSDADTAIEFDVGLGAANPKIKVSANDDSFRTPTKFIFEDDVVIEGTAVFEGQAQFSDKMISLNALGTTAGAPGSGFEVLGDSGAILAAVEYDATKTSKFIAGATGSKSEVLTAAGVQTVTARKKGNGFVPAGAVFPFAGRFPPAEYFLCNGAEKNIADEPDLYAAITYQLAVTTTNASANVTTASTVDLEVGAAIYGTNIPANAKINSITNATTFVISANATASGAITATIAPYDQQINPTTGAAWAAPASGKFRVPDHRSIYLRGAGTNNLGIVTGVGAWQDDATAKNGLSNASSALSSVTVDISHTHSSSSVSGSTGANTTGNDSPDHSHNAASGTLYNFRAGSFMGSSTPIRDFDSGTPATGGASTRHTHTIPSLSVSGTAAGQTLSGTSSTVTGTANAQVISSTDLETRPQSRGVLYIIKA